MESCIFVPNAYKLLKEQLVTLGEILDKHLLHTIEMAFSFSSRQLIECRFSWFWCSFPCYCRAWYLLPFSLEKYWERLLKSICFFVAWQQEHKWMCVIDMVVGTWMLRRSWVNDNAFWNTHEGENNRFGTKRIIVWSHFFCLTFFTSTSFPLYPSCVGYGTLVRWRNAEPNGNENATLPARLTICPLGVGSWLVVGELRGMWSQAVLLCSVSWVSSIRFQMELRLWSYKRSKTTGKVSWQATKCTPSNKREGRERWKANHSSLTQK